MWTEKRRYGLGGLAMILLGVTFMVAATGKLMAESTAFDLFTLPVFVPPTMATSIYILLPYVELVVGGLLVLGVTIKFAISLSALLIISFAASNIYLISLGHEECASCFGVLGSLTPTVSLIIDGIMAAWVVFILLCYKGNFFNKIPWFLTMEPKGRT